MTQKIEYAAIPTIYGGVKYRSRLEARWAVMFDLLGWSFDYEPFDLPGWIPDFKLRNPSPMSSRACLVDVTPESEFMSHAIKISKSGYKGDVVLLSEKFGAEGYHGGLIVGKSIVFEHNSLDNYRKYGFENAVVRSSCEGSGVCLSDENGSYMCKICTDYDGPRWQLKNTHRNQIIEAWPHAGNLVQWERNKTTLSSVQALVFE